jgi:hypothetical protein
LLLTLGDARAIVLPFKLAFFQVAASANPGVILRVRLAATPSLNVSVRFGGTLALHVYMVAGRLARLANRFVKRPAT